MTGPGGPVLDLEGVTIRRGPTLIVEGLSLRLEPGSIFWVVGPNGAGKSSLLRVLAGLDPPARGRVLRRPGGRPLYAHSEMALPGHATPRDWERLARRLLPGRPAIPGLHPGLEGSRAVRRHSTGERKRLLLDVLLRRPGPVLLDEPFEHLSPDAKEVLAGGLSHRARTELVVVATNQATRRAVHEGGLRLEGGRAGPLSGGGP